MKRYDQKAYKLPPPTQAHIPAETNKRLLEEQPVPSSKRFPNRSTECLSRPPLDHLWLLNTTCFTCADPRSTCVQIPDLPVQIPVTLELTTPQPPAQILLPDPTQPPAQILDPTVQISMTPEPTTLQQPVQIPNSPVQITVTPQLTTPQTSLQILLTHPPVLETLEPTITDDSSIDQIT
ncbi:hypothetical protein TNCV_706361 [Trichonephila clavipes]|nr:hypothetical protein TNCV_706361 [Trichonephila clavipes]